MRLILPLICLVLFLLSPETWNLNPETVGVSDSNLLGCFSYHFFHASWLHLILNGLCFYLLYKPLCALWRMRLLRVDSTFLLSMYAAACIAGLAAAQPIPTVGLSGIIFAMLGAALLLNPTLKQLKGYIYVFLAIIFQCFFGHSNVRLHICAFIFGALAVIIFTAANRLRITLDE